MQHKKILREFAAFVRQRGNCVALRLSAGSTYCHSKVYDRADHSGRALRTFCHHVQIATHDRTVATALLGADRFETRDGVHFLLDARSLTMLPGGYSILHVSGVRAGAYQLYRERRYAIRMADGTHLLAASPEGVRQKLIGALQVQLRELTRPGQTMRVSKAR